MSAGSDPGGGYLLPPPPLAVLSERFTSSQSCVSWLKCRAISSNGIEGILDNGTNPSAGWVSELGSAPGFGQLSVSGVSKLRMYAMPRHRSAFSAAQPPTSKHGSLADRRQRFARVERRILDRDRVGQPRGLAAYPAAAAGGGTCMGRSSMSSLAPTVISDPRPTRLQDLIGAFKDQCKAHLS